MKDKDKDEDPFAGSDRGLKKKKTSKDAEPVKSEELEFEVVDLDMPQDQEENPGNDDEEPKEKTFGELMSTPIDFSAYIMNGLKITNLTQETLLGPAFRLLKVPVDYFSNNDLKYLQGGVSTMTYTTYITKTKAAQYDLSFIKDMVPHIWVPVKVAYDKHALWGISHLEVNNVEVRKIGDFPRLRINDIEDMLLLKLGHSEASRRTSTRVESYQKKINITKPETTKSGIRKRDPYTPYQDPQGFIYVDNNGRNRLIVDKMIFFYKFSRRWSTLEKKRENIMTKAIDKQLKDRRMMRSLEKFIGGRHYGTDLRLLSNEQYDFVCLKVKLEPDEWIKDSGCSRHMTGNKDVFSSYKDIDGGNVVYMLASLDGMIENLVDKKVKIIICDNGTVFNNRVKRNRTLIKAARTMLDDSKLPTTFWAEAVNTACYVQNRVLIVKPHNKTPYELFRGRTLALSFMRPFGCHVTILNTLDHLGKFDGKSDDGFFVGYSLNSKAFRVYNIRTKKVEENLHIRFLEDKPIIAGDRPKWLFDIDVLTKSMNYVPVVAGTNSNDFVGTKESIGAGQSSKETGSSQDYILMPLWKDGLLFDSSSKNASNDESQPSSDTEKKDDESGIDDQEKPENSTQDINTAGPSINTASPTLNADSLNINTVSPTFTTARSNGSQTEPDMFSFRNNAILKAIHTYFFGDETKVDTSNINTTYLVPSTPNTRIHKDHSLEHVIGNVQSGVQTRRMTNEQGFISAVYEGKTHEDLHTFWTLVDLPYGKRAIGTKWVYKNKKDERGTVIRNKARLVAQGYTQDEGIDCDEVFTPVARIEEIRLFLAYASFKDFIVYQMDVKSAFLHGKIEEEVYVCQPLGFEDLEFTDKVYKVEKALYSLHQAPRAWKKMCTEFEKMMHKKFQMSSMRKLTFFLGLQVTQKDDGIFISQDKYVDEILKKFSFSTVKTASTPIETSKPLIKDAEAEDVDVHLYRSMVGSLMYLTTSRLDIMFAVCACARFQVTPKVSHLHAVKRIFRYLKGQHKLGLWYPKDSPFNLEAYTDSDYVGARLDRKSTTGGY
ncbi:retrovirus-related pol polyprotein from transposon TNT 1-94 [Tanacetum coccineum]